MNFVNRVNGVVAVVVVAAIATRASSAGEPRLRDTLRGNDRLVGSVIFSPDGKTLVSSAGLGATIWDLASGKSVAVVLRYDPIAPFSADGQTLVLTRTEYPKELYDLKSGKRTPLKKAAPGTMLIAFSPDGRTEVFSRGIDLWMRQLAGPYDLSGGQPAVALTGAAIGGLRQGATFSPDGKTLAMRDKDGDLMLWDVAGGTSRATLRQTAGFWFAFSPSGKTLVAACASKIPLGAFGGGKHLSPKLFDVGSGRSTGTLQEVAMNPIAFAAFSADGGTLVSAGVYITIHSPSSGAAISTLEKPAKGINPHIALSSDGKIVAAMCDDGTIRIWNVAGGKIAASLKDARTAPVFNPDGKTLAFGCADGSVQLWDIPTGTLTGR